MISKPIENPIIAISVKVYQALLVAYPAKFQQEYGLHMVQVFRDCCLRTVRQSGKSGMAGLWAVTLFDYIQSVVSEHRQKETEIKKELKSEDLRMAGWALILGGLAFIISLWGYLIRRYAYSNVSDVLLPFLCMPLFIVGLLAMRSRYGKAVGAFGKNILLAGAILGPLTSLIGIVLRGIAQASWSQIGEMGWALMVGGPAVVLACLALFGIVAFYKKPFPRWNILPFLAGFWFPALFIAWFVAFLNTGDTTNVVEGISSNVIIISLLTLQGIALAALGYILRSDAPEEIHAPA